MNAARRVARADWTVLLPALGLLALGVVFVHSATAERSPGLWQRQLLFAVAGLGAAGLVMAVGIRRLLDHCWELYAALLVLLVVTLLLPVPPGVGSASWIELPLGFKLQPSEFMKLGLILALARHLRHRGVTNTWSSYLGPFVLLAVPWFLVMRQPDLGSSVVLLPTTLAMVTVSGARLRHVAAVAAASVLLLLGAYHVPGVLRPYQRERLDAFQTSVPALMARARELRAQRDAEGSRAVEQELQRFKRGTGYQQFYSVVAIGSGGLTGAGLGEGLQNKSNRLPVRHSDFVVSVVGEEAGLVGTGLVILLQAALVAAIMGVAHRTREPFGRLVCVGVGAQIGSQALMNLGIAAGVLPVTGLTLPLVSYGGSSVLATCAGLGCVLDVARSRTAVFFES